jgi:hypothetical protein
VSVLPIERDILAIDRDILVIGRDHSRDQAAVAINETAALRGATPGGSIAAGQQPTIKNISRDT